MLGKNAEKRVMSGDVVRIRAFHDDCWPEHESGFVWAAVVDEDKNNGCNLDVVALPASLVDAIKKHWCEDGTWLTTMKEEDEVIIYKPDKIPQKFWGYLAYRELTGRAQAI